MKQWNWLCKHSCNTKRTLLSVIFAGTGKEVMVPVIYGKNLLWHKYFLSQLMKTISGVSSMDADVNWSFGNSSLCTQHMVSCHSTTVFCKYLEEHYNSQHSYLSQVRKTCSKSKFRTQILLTLETLCLASKLAHLVRSGSSSSLKSSLHQFQNHFS